ICSYFFFFSSRRRHTRFSRDWSSDVCSSDLTSPTTLLLLQALRNRAATKGSVVGLVLIAPAVDFTEALMWQCFPAKVKREIEDRSEERRVGKEWRWRWSSEQ